MMRPVVKMLVVAGALLGGIQAAQAGDASRFAVMGVRLGMSATDVLEVLYGQGVRESAVSQHTHPCALLSVAGCTDTITAKLPDGPIVIRFAEAPPGFNDGRESAYSIAYTVVANGPSQYALLQGRAAERYGVSDRQAIWCDPPAAHGGVCPEDAPRLSFERHPGAAGVLTLADSDMPQRLRMGLEQDGRP